MEIEKVKTLIIITLLALIFCGLIAYVSFTIGQSNQLGKLADRGEFVVRVPLNDSISIDKTELKVFRLQDFFVTIENYNKLQGDCQEVINQLIV